MQLIPCKLQNIDITKSFYDTGGSLRCLIWFFSRSNKTHDTSLHKRGPPRTILSSKYLETVVRYELRNGVARVRCV